MKAHTSFINIFCRIGTDIVEGLSELESETDIEEGMSMVESGKLIISPLGIESEVSAPESRNLGKVEDK
jgi:hypothetical protein